MLSFPGPESSLATIDRKFYIFVASMNAIGIFLAAIGEWQYPRKYTGAFVLGNLLTAILMRNELFGRFLYLIVNTLFAKVSADRPRTITLYLLCAFPVDTTMVPAGMHVGAATSRRDSLRMRDFGLCMADISSHPHFHQPQRQSRRGSHNGGHYQSGGRNKYSERIPLGQEYASQVRPSNSPFSSNDLTLCSSVFERHHRFIGW